MTRIKNCNIKYGEDFVLPAENNFQQKRIQEALEQEKLIIAHAEQHARQLLEQAQADSNNIIEEAKAQALGEVDAIKTQAYNEGYEAGRQQGYQDISNEMQDKIQAVDIFSKSTFEIKNNIIKSAHSDIVQLVIEIARKVCSKTLELDENVIKDITANAIKALKDKENITIIVNPELAEKIYSISEELKERIPQLENIKIIEDNSVSPDGTIVETPLSRVDSRISSQIDEIAAKLMAKLDSTSAEELQNND